jgi:hypothetical protein
VLGLCGMNAIIDYSKIKRITHLSCWINETLFFLVEEG